MAKPQTDKPTKTGQNVRRPKQSVKDLDPPKDRDEVKGGIKKPIDKSTPL